MFNRKIIKLVTGVTTAICVGNVTGEVIAQNTEVEDTQDKIQVGIAAFVLGGMAGTAAWNYTDQYVDNIADGLATIRESRKITKEAKKAQAAAAQVANN